MANQGLPRTMGCPPDADLGCMFLNYLIFFCYFLETFNLVDGKDRLCGLCITSLIIIPQDMLFFCFRLGQWIEFYLFH